MVTARYEAVCRAARIVKDLQKLRALLNVPMRDLRAWLEGRGHPPVHAFLQAVDIIEAQDEGDGERLI